MSTIGTPEILLLLAVVLLLFGAKRLPDLSRSLGRSMRIFRAETRALNDDERVVTPAPPATALPGQAVPPTPQAATPPPAAPNQTPPAAGTTPGSVG
jgi:sec-independent protein translocase protein TatA